MVGAASGTNSPSQGQIPAGNTVDKEEVQKTLQSIRSKHRLYDTSDSAAKNDFVSEKLRTTFAEAMTEATLLDARLQSYDRNFRLNLGFDIAEASKDCKSLQTAVDSCKKLQKRIKNVVDDE